MLTQKFQNILGNIGPIERDGREEGRGSGRGRGTMEEDERKRKEAERRTVRV